VLLVGVPKSYNGYYINFRSSFALFFQQSKQQTLLNFVIQDNAS